MKKLDYRWIGPFQILKVVSAAALRPQLMAREKGVHPAVSVSNMCHYTPDDIPECPNNPTQVPTLLTGARSMKLNVSLT